MPKAKPAYKSYATPRRVSTGSVSRPKPLGKPRPVTEPNLAIRRVKA